MKTFLNFSFSVFFIFLLKEKTDKIDIEYRSLGPNI